MATTQALPNSAMVSGRYLRWARSRALYRRIADTLSSGRHVQVTTYTKSWIYGPEHLRLFSCGKNGVFVIQGKQRNDITNCGIRFETAVSR